MSDMLADQFLALKNGDAGLPQDNYPSVDVRVRGKVYELVKFVDREEGYVWKDPYDDTFGLTGNAHVTEAKKHVPEDFEWCATLRESLDNGNRQIYLYGWYDSNEVVARYSPMMAHRTAEYHRTSRVEILAE